MLSLFKKKRALLIVDVQTDFLPGGALAVPKGDEVVPVINRLQGEYDLVVATKDLHPPRHCSFASTHPGRKIGDRADLERGSQLLWPDHCIKGTKGAEFAPGLQTQKVAKIFEKGIQPDIDSYSALYDNDRGRATGLEEYLKQQKIGEVHIVGLATDYTVKYTALDCQKAGFKTHVLLEGCRGIDTNAGDVSRAVTEMKNAGVQVK